MVKDDFFENGEMFDMTSYAYNITTSKRVVKQTSVSQIIRVDEAKNFYAHRKIIRRAY